MVEVSLKNNKGFTLVEVVAATAIMGIAFAALISLFTMSARLTGATRERTDMMMIAQDLVEYSLNVEKYGVGSGVPAGWLGSLDPAYASRYDVQRSVENVYDSGGTRINGLLKIVIKVKSKEMTSFDAGVVLVTQISDVVCGG